MAGVLIEELVYELKTADGIWFDTGDETVEWETADCSISVSATGARVRLLNDFYSLDDARRAVEPELRAWELHHALNQRSQEVSLRYKEAVVRQIDRQSQAILAGSIPSGAMFGDLRVQLGRRSLPPAPAGFAVTPLVDRLWRRYEDYRLSREKLTSAAYFCLTELEGTGGGGRTRAATKYGIHPDVLGQLGRIVSTRGNELEARKASAVSGALTPRETEWLDAAIRAIILRVGCIAGAKPDDQPLPQLTMADLPPSD